MSAEFASSLASLQAVFAKADQHFKSQEAARDDLAAALATAKQQLQAAQEGEHKAKAVHAELNNSYDHLFQNFASAEETLKQLDSKFRTVQQQADAQADEVKRLRADNAQLSAQLNRHKNLRSAFTGSDSTLSACTLADLNAADFAAFQTELDVMRKDAEEEKIRRLAAKQVAEQSTLCTICLDVKANCA